MEPTDQRGAFGRHPAWATGEVTRDPGSDRPLEVVFGPSDRHPVPASTRTPGGPEVGRAGATPLPSRLTPRRLKAALTAVGVLVAALAGGWYIQQRPTATERAMSEAIAAYTAAWTAHDRDAMVAVMTSNATFAAGDSLQRPLLTVARGPELDRLLRAMFDASVSLETRGDILVAGDDRSHASVPQRYRYNVNGLHVVEDGLSLFTFIEVQGTLKVGQHMWWRPRSAQAPSMLWVSPESGQVNP